MSGLFYVTGDFQSQSNLEAYCAAIDHSARHSSETREHLKHMLKLLIEAPITTQEQLRDQLKAHFGVKNPNISRYLSYLADEVERFNLRIDRPSKSGVELRYRRRSRIHVLIWGTATRKPHQVLDWLRELNKKLSEEKSDIRIVQAATTPGEIDVCAIIEGPDFESAFQFVLRKIDGHDEEIRTTSRPLAGLDEYWELFEPVSSESPSEEPEAPKSVPRKKTHKRVEKKKPRQL
jgi:uncharacterized protein with GYD domain